MKTIVIGAGASGLTAAIFAAQNGSEVVVLEKENKSSKKILMTGNGKCNLTNRDMTSNYFYGDPKLITSVLSLFGVQDTLNFFNQMGIFTTEKNGYVYPRSRQAQTVADTLREYAVSLGVKIKNNAKIHKIKKSGTKFFIYTEIVIECDALILATGGKAAPATGSDGSGYDFAIQLGHTIHVPKPALTSLICENHPLKKASGVRIMGTVAIPAQKKYESGEIQITNYGISGIPVFNISRLTAPGTELMIDFMPEFSKAELADILTKIITCRQNITLHKALCGLLNDKLSISIIDFLGWDKNRIAETLSESQRNSLVEILKAFPLTIHKRRGFEYAQVTQGGIPAEELNIHTMESKLVEKLYFAGEIIDVDGICGGYNLQFAWSSGAIAGRSCSS